MAEKMNNRNETENRVCVRWLKQKMKKRLNQCVNVK